jgi:hypothetical protein
MSRNNPFPMDNPITAALAAAEEISDRVVEALDQSPGC